MKKTKCFARDTYPQRRTDDVRRLCLQELYLQERRYSSFFSLSVVASSIGTG